MVITDAILVKVVGGALVATIVGGTRWFLKIDRGLESSAANLALLHERLNGHEKLDDQKHTEVDRRLGALEGKTR